MGVLEILPEGKKHFPENLRGPFLGENNLQVAVQKR